MAAYACIFSTYFLASGPESPPKSFPMAYKLWPPDLGVSINKSYQYKGNIEAN